MSEENYTCIDEPTFGDYSNLTSLKLIHLKLNFIHPNAFNHLYALKELSLCCNNLTSLHPLTFNGLSQLEKIKLEM